MIFTWAECGLFFLLSFSIGWVLYPSEYTRGLMMRKEGDRTAAIAFFKDYLRRYPDHKGATMALAAAYEEAGVPEEAVAPMFAFYSVRRGDEESGKNLLDLMKRTGLEARSAAFRWNLIKDLNARPLSPKKDLLGLLFEEYHSAAARSDDLGVIRALNELARLDAGEDYRSEILRLLLARRKFDAALSHLREDMRRNPKNPETRWMIVRILRQKGDWIGALREIESALEAFPGNLDFLSERASLYAQRSKWEDAAADYSSLSERQPGKEDWSREKAHALLQLGRFEEAFSILDALRKKTPGERSRWWDAIYPLSDRDEPERAAKLLEDFLKVFPGDSEGWSYLVEQYQKSGRIDLAIGALERRVKKSPKDIDSRRSLAQLLQDEERFDECVPHYAAMIAQRPSDQALRPLLAYIHESRGNPRAAVEVYEEQLRLFPEDGVSLDKLVSHLVDLGEKKRALALLSRHFRSAPARLSK